ncbi:M23 family metallopeptidase [Alteromonas sp. ASW11-19]|uniref:M23 family metallopeptidase n=1 Tax=Alteromonas salexigens TaxID=2982530 RepID=A0ABT2VUK4_9ALTE|nr:M23 family metallopeptidase [Alteromonas salexigens]MCU7555539.1 M23 family metallopeptidase [Alteromonas salexigens]
MKVEIKLYSESKSYFRSYRMRDVVSITVLCSLFMLVSSRSTDSVSEDLARIKLAQTAMTTQQDEVTALKTNTSEKLNALVTHIASLSAKVNQLDSQNARLAEELGMAAADLDAFVPAALPDEHQDGPIMQQITALQQSLDSKAQQLTMLESLVRGHHISEQSTLSGRPIKSGWLSSYYGMRADPFTGEQAMHKGLDFAGEAGDSVVATAAGVVTWSGDRYGYGNLVEIEHGDGVVSRYGHNQSLLVSVGDVVTKGQQIAVMGNTGRSTGAHVHYEVIRNGQQIDPLPFVYKK